MKARGLQAMWKFLSHLYDTYQEAISASKTYKGIIESKVGLLKCDFSQVPDAYSKSFVCNYYDITNIDNSPDIKQYMRKNRMLIETTKVKTKALKKLSMVKIHISVKISLRICQKWLYIGMVEE